ncbi:KRAB-A domain-containing protein 2, partial [Trichinella spiralis]
MPYNAHQMDFCFMAWFPQIQNVIIQMVLRKQN